MNRFKCAAAAVFMVAVLFGSAETAQAQRRLGGLAAMGAGAVLLAFSSHDVCMTSGRRGPRSFSGWNVPGGAITMEHVFDEIECTADDISLTAPGAGSETTTRAAWRTRLRELDRTAANLGRAGLYDAELEFVDGFTAELETETRPAFLYGGIGTVAAGALAAFWPSAPVRVSPDVRNNGLRVSRTFGW